MKGLRLNFESDNSDIIGFLTYYNTYHPKTSPQKGKREKLLSFFRKPLTKEV